MSQKVVLKLSADWCGPCKKIAPFFHDLSKKYTDIKFIEVNVEDNFTDFYKGLSGPQIAEKYPSNGIPYFVFLHNDSQSILSRFSSNICTAFGFSDKISQ